MKSLNSADKEEKLVKLAQAGDAAAEEALIRSYKQAIRSKAHVYFIAGADSEDIVQEGMIGLLKAIRSYSEGSGAGFRTYAEVCITRQILSAIRAANRKKHEPLNESVSIDMPVEGAAAEGVTLGDTLGDGGVDDPETLLIMKEDMDVMESDIFSDLELAVLNAYMDGESYDSIAERLGKSRKAVDNALQRARRKLAEYWQA